MTNAAIAAVFFSVVFFYNFNMYFTMTNEQNKHVVFVL